MLTYQYNIYDNSTQSLLLKSIKMNCSLLPKFIYILPIYSFDMQVMKNVAFSVYKKYFWTMSIKSVNHCNFLYCTDFAKEPLKKSFKSKERGDNTFLSIIRAQLEDLAKSFYFCYLVFHNQVNSYFTKSL